MSRNHRRQVTINSFFFFGSRVVDLVGIVLNNVILARYLGAVLLGEYTFIVVTVVSIMTISYFGLDRIVTRDITHNLERAAEFVGAVIVVRWGLSILATALVFAALPFMGVAAELRIAFVAVVASEFIGAAASVIVAVFRGYERIQYEVYVTFFFRILNLLLIVIAVILDSGITGICVAILAANSLRFILSLWVLRAKFVVPVFSFNLVLIKKIALDAVVLGTTVLFSSWFFRLAQIVLKSKSGPEHVAYFQVAHAILLQTAMVSVSMGTAILPMIASHSTDSPEDKQEVGRVYEDITKMLAGLSLLASGGLILVSKEIISIIYGEQFMPGLSTMQMLFVAIVPFYLHSFNTFIFIGYNKVRYLITSWIVALAVSFTLYLLVIPGYGSFGAAVSYTIGLIALVASQLLFMRHKVPNNLLQVPLVMFLFNTFLVILCGWASMKSEGVLVRAMMLLLVIVVATVQLKEHIKKWAKAFRRHPVKREERLI